MKTEEKSTVEEIRTRFDGDVERFSKLETGQVATMDAAFAMDLVARTAASLAPTLPEVLDLGCGAGNYSLKFREYRPQASFTLVDLSRPMLDRARERLGPAAHTLLQSDLRALAFEPARFDVIVAAAVLHHLRTPSEWKSVFQNLHRWLKPGGSVWIFDLVTHETPEVQDLLWEDYRNYLESIGGPDYRAKVFAYIEREDSPAPLTYQLGLLREAGFKKVDVLHKRACFAAFGAVR